MIISPQWLQIGSRLAKGNRRDQTSERNVGIFSDAYKQIHFFDQAYERDASLAVLCPETGVASISEQPVLAFGSIVSVTAKSAIGHLGRGELFAEVGLVSLLR